MPQISVVMSTYNRADMIKQSAESVLGQTYSNFEFIIIDDCSKDNTCQIIEAYKDGRIKLIKNRQRKGCTFNYHVAQNISRGKYIAHIDDDDIWAPDKLEKQINYMLENSQIVLCGTFIETFGENSRPSWVFYIDGEQLDFAMNFYNPICHSSILYNKLFMEHHNINYNVNYLCSQDYEFYKQILLNGGKLANIEDNLVKYRMHSHRLTDIKESQFIQIENADKVKTELLSRFLNEAEIQKVFTLLKDFPFNKYNKENVLEAMNIIKTGALKNGLYNEEKINFVIDDIASDRYTF